VLLLALSGLPPSNARGIGDAKAARDIAFNPIEVAPKYVHAAIVNAQLSFSGTTATCTGAATGKSGTTSITLYMTLQVKSANDRYTTIKAWPAEKTAAENAQMRKTQSVTRGCTYRLNVSAVVLRNGTSETVSKSTEGTCP